MAGSPSGGERAGASGTAPADVLIVEDDPLIALDLEETVIALGAAGVRAATSVAAALAAIEARAPDFAFLDINLGSEPSFDVGDRLEALNIPFAFVTGYGMDAPIPARFAGRPIVGKPFSSDDVAQALRSGDGSQARASQRGIERH
jgi:CheY-like chemotaxis protein